MANIQVRASEMVKQLSSKVFESYGLDLSSAIRLFLKKTIVEGKMPFDPRYDVDEYNRKIQEIENKMISEIGEDEEKLLDVSNEIICETRNK